MQTTNIPVRISRARSRSSRTSGSAPTSPTRRPDIPTPNEAPATPNYSPQEQTNNHAQGFFLNISMSTSKMLISWDMTRGGGELEDKQEEILSNIVSETDD